jgi:hypothetical protein
MAITKLNEIQALRPLDGSPQDNMIAMIVTELEHNGRDAARYVADENSAVIGLLYPRIARILD